MSYGKRKLLGLCGSFEILTVPVYDSTAQPSYPKGHPKRETLTSADLRLHASNGQDFSKKA